MFKDMLFFNIFMIEIEKNKNKYLYLCVRRSYTKKTVLKKLIY